MPSHGIIAADAHPHNGPAEPPPEQQNAMPTLTPCPRRGMGPKANEHASPSTPKASWDQIKGTPTRPPTVNSIRHPPPSVSPSPPSSLPAPSSIESRPASLTPTHQPTCWTPAEAENTAPQSTRPSSLRARSLSETIAIKDPDATGTLEPGLEGRLSGLESAFASFEFGITAAVSDQIDSKILVALDNSKLEFRVATLESSLPSFEFGVVSAISDEIDTKVDAALGNVTIQISSTIQALLTQHAEKQRVMFDHVMGELARIPILHDEIATLRRENAELKNELARLSARSHPPSPDKSPTESEKHSKTKVQEDCPTPIRSAHVDDAGFTLALAEKERELDVGIPQRPPRQHGGSTTASPDLNDDVSKEAEANPLLADTGVVERPDAEEMVGKEKKDDGAGRTEEWVTEKRGRGGGKKETNPEKGDKENSAKKVTFAPMQSENHKPRPALGLSKSATPTQRVPLKARANVQASSEPIRTTATSKASRVSKTSATTNATVSSKTTAASKTTGASTKPTTGTKTTVAQPRTLRERTTRPSYR